MLALCIFCLFIFWEMKTLIMMHMIDGFNFCRLLKWEKLGFQYQLFGWCPSTKPLLAAWLHPELLILHLDGEYYVWKFSASALSCEETCFRNSLIIMCYSTWYEFILTTWPAQDFAQNFNCKGDSYRSNWRKYVR